LNFIKDFFLEANPNPERVGCPDEPTIKALAEDRLPVTHPGRLHLAACSECFAEYRSFRQQWLGSRRGRRKVLAWAIAASLALFAAGLGLWKFGHIHAPEAQIALSAPVESHVDLFNAGTSRGLADGINELQSVILPAAVVHLDLTLPRFSDPGPYQVLVSKDKAASQIVAKGTASTRETNGRQTLELTLDLRSAQTGAYFLATVRGEDNGTYYYPLTVRTK
jgi:hypothetical protein